MTVGTRQGSGFSSAHEMCGVRAVASAGRIGFPREIEGRGGYPFGRAVWVVDLSPMTFGAFGPFGAIIPARFQARRHAQSDKKTRRHENSDGLLQV